MQRPRLASAQPRLASAQPTPVRDPGPSLASAQLTPVPSRPDRPPSAARRAILPVRKRRAPCLEAERYKLFLTLFFRCTSSLHYAHSVKHAEIARFVANSGVDPPFTDHEVVQALEMMEDDSKIMQSEENIYII